jgi:hypothetical protein
VVDWIHFTARGGSMDVADIAIQLGVLGAIIALVVGDRVRRSREVPRAGEAAAAPPARDAQQLSQTSEAGEG